MYDVGDGPYGPGCKLTYAGESVEGISRAQQEQTFRWGLRGSV